MAFLSHKGGSMVVTGIDGNLETLHYGPGLHRKCPTCNQPKLVRCRTNSGKLLNKCHSDRR